MNLVWIFLAQNFQECANKVNTPGDEDLDRSFETQGGNNPNGLSDGWNHV